MSAIEQRRVELIQDDDGALVVVTLDGAETAQGHGLVFEVNTSGNLPVVVSDTDLAAFAGLLTELVAYYRKGGAE